jgi:hypothetical protein
VTPAAPVVHIAILDAVGLTVMLIVLVVAGAAIGLEWAVGTLKA